MIEFLSPRRRDGLARFSGRFVDLHTAVFALTGQPHSLRSAGEALKAEVLKQEGAATHGKAITPQYLDYLVNDVWATTALLDRVLELYELPSMIGDAVAIGTDRITDAALLLFSFE